MGGKILIVDDQAVMLRLISIPLEQEGFTTVTAVSGVEALQKIQSERPDLVIMDVMLPDTSGIDVVRRVRQVLNLTDLPIIILSGQTELAAKIQGLEAGADDYVTKPVDPKEMVVRVKAMLARTQRLRQGAPAAAPSRQGRLIAVIGAKGGVGTTTVSANLAVALAMRNHRTLLVEMRPYYGTLARHFGITPSATLSQLLELAPKAITDAQVSARLMPLQPGLQLLAGPQNLREYREIQSEQADVLCSVFGAMASYAVLDLPHLPSVANRAVLRASQLVVVVMEPEPSCITAAYALVELLRAWSIPTTSAKLVMVNRTQSVQLQSVAEIERTLGCDLLGTVVAAADAAVNAVNVGKPLVNSAPSSLVAGTLMEIADRVAALRPVGARS
jgi:DNA-binding response OmpR family regulator